MVSYHSTEKQKNYQIWHKAFTNTAFLQAWSKKKKKNLAFKYSQINVFWSWGLDSAPPPVGKGEKYNLHSYRYRIINCPINFQFKY